MLEGGRLTYRAYVKYDASYALNGWANDAWPMLGSVPRPMISALLLFHSCVVSVVSVWMVRSNRARNTW